MTAPGEVRIGELSRRTGVSVELLRAWEKRYGLLKPSRTASGYRLYSETDERRVRQMQRGVAEGLAAAEAARVALAAASVVADGSGPGGAAAELRGALDRFDDAAANAALDSLFATFTFETVGRDVILPLLREIGDRWRRGELSVAQEHFASNVLRGRLFGLARGWDHGVGPRAVLACAPEEHHELALIVFGIALRAQGWRITYLGADTPVDSLDPGDADAVVIAATAPERFESVALQLEQLARTVDLAIAGAGASEEIAEKLGARLLPPDPFAAAAVMWLTPNAQRDG
jgi:MerR family transcriptional regulator, light-induced transcriptional regulator